MEDRRPRLAARIAALGAAAGAVGLLFAPVPTGWLGAWHDRILDFGHVPLFAVLVVALHVGMGGPLFRPLLAALALAGFAEVAQPLVGRTGDAADFLRGALGTLCGGCVVRAWESRGARVRVAYLILAAALPVWPVVEVAPYLADTVAGRRAFPTLASFATDRELLRWECDQASLTRADGAGVRVDFLPGPDEYPGVALRPIVGDFGGYRWLCAEFRVVGGPLDLVTSVRTGSGDPRQTAHTDVARRYPTGEHTARLDLAVMSAQGQPEQLDLSDIRQVIFFVVRPRETRTIVLARVWLEP